jgi:hypothetical protein
MGSCSSKSTGAENVANGQKQQSPPTTAASPKTDKAPVQTPVVNKEKGGKVSSADSVASVSKFCVFLLGGWVLAAGLICK